MYGIQTVFESLRTRMMIRILKMSVLLKPSKSGIKIINLSTAAFLTRNRAFPAVAWHVLLKKCAPASGKHMTFANLSLKKLLTK